MGLSLLLFGFVCFFSTSGWVWRLWVVPFFFNASGFAYLGLCVSSQLSANNPPKNPMQTVQPQQGQALIWPSVLDDHPLEVDIRTHHQALQVLDGVKYGANVWVHQRDYKDAYQRNCQ